MAQNGISLCILILNLGCDQVSKQIVRERVDYFEVINLIDEKFILTKVENTGAFLSIGSNFPDIIKFILLAGVPLLSLAFGIVYLFTRKKLSILSKIALACAIGGGIGNIYDRIQFGSVTDFLHIKIGMFQTGIFNLADVSIMLGMGLFTIESIINNKKKSIRKIQ
jgi:signal peptidase II